MKILTKDKRLLYLYRIGEPDMDGSDKLHCTNDAGKRVVITWGEVLLCFGSYTFSVKN